MDDRLLTKDEYKQFLETCADLEKQEHWQNLTELLAATFIKLNDQIIYVQILESLLETRSAKLTQLENTLNTLEKELIELRCLTKTK